MFCLASVTLTELKLNTYFSYIIVELLNVHKALEDTYKIMYNLYACNNIIYYKT